MDIKEINKEDKVLIIGEVKLHINVYGKVNRVSDENSIVVVDFDRLENTIGGKVFKLASKLKTNKVSVFISSIIGPGKEGQIVLDKLKNYGMSCNLSMSENKVTCTDLRTYDDSGRLIGLVEKRNKNALSPVDINMYLGSIENFIKQHNINTVVFFDNDFYNVIKDDIVFLCKKMKVKFMN